MNENELLNALAPPQPAPEGFYTIAMWSAKSGRSREVVRKTINAMVDRGEMRMVIASIAGRTHEVYGPAKRG